MPDWTPGDLAAVLGNPFYAINIDPSLARPHEPLVSEEQWIAANVRAIEENGPEVYLRNLLSVLKGNYGTQEQAGSPPRPTPGRNDPCWCGSGKKFKHCHGR
jgi:uncharacterized protein YecA (UPF0149 family)